MKHEERTYIGSAEIRLDNIARRDALVKAAKGAGFLVECNEAISITLSGGSSPTYWAITVYAQGIIPPTEKREARARLASAWRGL